MFIDDIKIGKKLISGFLIVVGIAVIISVIGYFFISNMDSMMNEIYQDRLLPTDQLGKIEASLQMIRGEAYKAILLPDEREASLKKARDAIDVINSQIALYKQKKFVGDEEQQVKNFEKAWGAYQSEVGNVLTNISAGQTDSALAGIAAGSATAKARGEIDVAMTSLRKTNLDRADELKKTEDKDSDFAMMAMILLTILAAVVGITLGIYLTRSITKPLSQTVTMLEHLSLGKLGMRLNLVRKDEVGVMARTMDNFADSLQHDIIGKMKDIADGVRTDLVKSRDDADEITPALNTTISALDSLVNEISKLTDAASKGNLSIRGEPESFKGNYQDIIRGINMTLDAVVTPVQESMRLAGSYSKGVYTDRFDPGLQVAGDFTGFRDAMDQIGAEGSDAISEVQRQVELLLSGMEETSASVEEVTASSGVLAQSSNKVSELAEHSGEGVKQVLTAMEDLSTAVSSVAGKAEQVSGLSLEAVDLSNHGAEQAKRAEEGMQGIISSFGKTDAMISDISRQMGEIGKIVKVISDIADQTNLLALNAAIEAARAGDAGLGFAVVADEVKSLALESQKSAENIAGIIGTLQQMSKEVNEAMEGSSEEVKAGSAAVTESLAVFSDIVKSINDISSHMGEVAGATQEQAASVQEITASVNEVGALIEQTAKEAIGSAAASEEASAALDQISQVITSQAESVNRISQEMGRFTV
ncbi:methyl-accepting chemotaxis protein [uncultured Methanospirillum sp.]|uniref:methyl-accepting chemotaxis protein n=1 Tax=uncultured Methanospirillum sp. TaxID=262503 RepID=UPI0029C65BF9|nr:methyl-accepting chemotaxis protein [uncultured Methanospirillum sp.]